MMINKHGSFYIRNSWPTKILAALQEDPYIFSPNRELFAVDNLGVGQADSHSRILYGSYGTGKSHFLTVLSILLSKKYNSGHAFDTLIHRIKSYDANLANDIKNYEQNDDCLPFLVVPVTSDYPDFNTCVYHSLRNS